MRLRVAAGHDNHRGASHRTERPLRPIDHPSAEGEPRARRVPVSGLGRRSAALGGSLGGWRVASKRVGPLPRRRGSALARGCGRGGRVVLPLARATVISTGLRVHGDEVGAVAHDADRLAAVAEGGLVDALLHAAVLRGERAARVPA